jgi:excisionase family DNA binding protein
MTTFSDRPTAAAGEGHRGSPQRLLTVREVAEFLQVHPKTVLRFTRSEGLPCLRLRARLRFDPADVVRWVSVRKEG